MTLAVSTVRPGIVVTLHTSIQGNVNYSKRNLADGVNSDGNHVKEWETTRTVFDPVEYERASKVRAKARNTIALACIVTPSLGLLCPKDNEAKLEEAIKEARRITREFNREANLTSIRLSVILSRIVDNDVEATRAINSEIASLMAMMQKGIENVDATAIRKAALNAKRVAGMLTPAASERVQEYIKLAREQATKIVKAGESANVEVDKAALDLLRSKRTAFLDLEDDIEIRAPAVVSKRAVDISGLSKEDLANPVVQAELAEGNVPVGKVKAMKIQDVIGAVKFKTRKPKKSTVRETLEPANKDPMDMSEKALMELAGKGGAERDRILEKAKDISVTVQPSRPNKPRARLAEVD